MRATSIRHLVTALVLSTLLVSGACKKDAPPEPPKVTPDVPAEPAVEVIDLDQVQQSLAATDDVGAAVNALVALAKALETPGAIAEGQEARAKELKTAAGFDLLVRSALGEGDADVAAIANALSLEKAGGGALPLLREFGAQVGAGSSTGKAAEVVAWLATPAGERAALPAPDRNTWRSLLKDDAPAGVAVRAATLAALEDVLRSAGEAHRAPSPSALAEALGPLLCAKCDVLPEAEIDAIAALLYDPSNRGYVCEPAAEKLADASAWAYPRALAETCHPSDFGLSEPGEMTILSAGNALTLRGLAIALEARTPPKDEKNPLAPVLAARRAAVEEPIDGMIVPLALPWLPVAADAPDEAVTVRPPAHVTGLGAERPSPPLETFVVAKDGVAMAIRPVATVRQGAIVLEDRTAGLAWPGKRLVDAEGVDASDEKRDAAAKEAGEEVADEDVITEVAAGAAELQQRTDPITRRAFPAAQPAVSNVAREAGQRSALLAVDAAAPAWLLRRTLASMAAAGYRYPLVPRAAADDLAGEHVLPIVFRSTEALADGVAQPRFERPILVVVGAKAVEVFPPHKRLPETTPADEKAEGDEKAAGAEKAEADEKDSGADGAEADEKAEGDAQPAELTWPDEAKRVLDPNNRLYTYEIALPEGDGPVGPVVARAVAKLGQDQTAGNVVYVIADAKAPAGRVLEVVDALTTAPGEAIAAPAGIEPGLVCDADRCPTRVVVLFPRISRPRMPEKREARAPKPKKRDEGNATGPAGFCSKGNIRSVVTRRSGSFRFCYEKELQLQPDLRGKLTVQFTIGRDGTVPKARIVSSTIRQRKVEQCVLKVFRRMRFDKPQGGICVVNWPLKFQ